MSPATSGERWPSTPHRPLSRHRRGHGPLTSATCAPRIRVPSSGKEACMTSLTRRELLKAGGALAVTAAAPAIGVESAAAQTPRRGGVFRFAMQLDPQGFDPHATVSFVTMIPLSFSHSRLVKVKAGPTVKPGTYPIEPDVAESWTEPNVRLLDARNPHYFVPGLPNADGVEILLDRDPSSRLASWLGGKIDFAPEYQMVVRRLDLDVARRQKPGMQSVEYPWPVMGLTGFKLNQEPFKDVRVRRALSRATSLADIFESNAFSLGHYVAQAVVPAALGDWSIPIGQLGPEGRKDYQHDTAEAKRLLAAAGHPNGFTTTVDTTAGFGPDFIDYVQVLVRNWKDAGIDAQLNIKEYGAFVSTTIFGKFDKMMAGLRAIFTQPDSYLAQLFLPESPLNILGVNDSRLTDMIRLQRRTFDVAKRRDIIWDVQRYVAEQGYFGVNGSAKVVSAWDAHVRNFMPNNGYDYGGRLMAAWIAK